MQKPNLITLSRLLVSLGVALTFAYGYYGLRTYVLPLSNDDLVQARQSLVADESEILINGAARAYEQKHFEESVKVLELALERLLDKSGRYRALDTYKLERAYFLLAKTYQKLEKDDKAISNYEDTLRLNPWHVPAKYNLEMLQQKKKQKGGGEGQSKPDPATPEPKI